MRGAWRVHQWQSNRPCLWRSHADHNRLAQLPSGLPALSSLECLQLSHNSLRELPGAWRLRQLPALAALHLGHNQLQQLPAGCSGLKLLDLSGNGLCDAALESAVFAQAPGACGCGCGCGEQPAALQLRRLAALDVSGNALTHLPGWLPAGLVALSAGGNAIQEVPAALCERLAGGCVALQLQGNRLQQLPPAVKLCSQLQVLALAGNPGLHPDAGEHGCRGLAWAHAWLARQKAAMAAAALRGKGGG
jgi:hypothetical protein